MRFLKQQALMSAARAATTKDAEHKKVIQRVRESLDRSRQALASGQKQTVKVKSRK
jgi:hypothetical protein